MVIPEDLSEATPMRLFRRKQQTTTMPAEVAEYYQAERRDRRSAKWLITLFTLLVTIAIVIGLFLAGRWLYRTIKGNDAPQTATTQTQSSDNSQSANSSSSDTQDKPKSADNRSDNSSDKNTSNTGNSKTDNSRTDSSSSNGSSTDSNSSNDTNTQGSAGTQTPQGSSGTGDDLTNTGPGETTAVVFVGASVLGYTIYRRRLARG